MIEIKETDKQELVRCILGSKPFSKKYALDEKETINVVFRDLTAGEDDYINETVITQEKTVTYENYYRLYLAIVEYKGEVKAAVDYKTDDIIEQAENFIANLSTIERDLLMHKYAKFVEFTETLFQQLTDPNS